MFSRWFLYTVLCGAIPIVGRLTIFWLVEDQIFSALNAGDFIAYGLVLHIAMLNSLDGFHPSINRWTTLVNGIAIFGIVIYAILFTLHTTPIFNGNNKILFFSISCTACSVLLGVLIQILLTKIKQKETENDN